MRTETVVREIFTFDELSPEAQAKAIDRNRDINTDCEWWECTYEYFTELFSTFGIDISKIYFSGFSSQGDGAMFEADYRHKPGGVKALAAYSTKIPKEVTEAAAQLLELQKRNAYRICASSKHSGGNYYHENMMDVNTWDKETGDSYKFYEGGQETEIKEIFRSLAKWIYRTLETEYFDLISDELIKETIQANEYEFTEDGERA